MAVRPLQIGSALLLLASLPAHGGLLKGRILSADKPAAGVTVVAVPYESPWVAAKRQARGGPAPAALASTTTGTNGAFSLTVPADPAHPDAEVRIRLEGEGMADTLLPEIFGVSESEDLGDRSVARGEKLAGRVVDSAGGPVSDATVTLLGGFDREEGAPVTRPLVTVHTSGDGTFRFDGATSTANGISVEKAGFAPVQMNGLRSGALARPLVLTRGARLAGSVRTSDRKSPAEGALVRWEGVATTTWVVTGADGVFVLPNVPEKVSGRLFVDGGEAGTAEIASLTIPLTGDRKPSLFLVPPATFEGKLVEVKSGRGVPRAKLTLSSGGSSLSTRSGPDGRYRFRPVAAGRQSLQVDEPRYVRYQKNDVTLSPGELKKLDVPMTLGATLAGRVTDETGAPVSGAKGRITAGGQTGIQAFLRQMRSTETVAFRSGADGTFRATRLAPGENQRLTVSHPEFERATLAGLSLPTGGIKPSVGVVLHRGSVITGVVKDAEGNPVAGAELEMSSSQGFRSGRGGRGGMSLVNGAASRQRETSGGNGRFTLKGISAGDYTLAVKKPGYATERIDPLKVSEQTPPAPLEVILLPGAVISGTVKSKSGNGAEGYRVLAAAPGAQRMGGGGGLAEQEPTGPDGTFLLEGLKAGQAYDLQTIGGEGMGPQKRGVIAPANDVELVVSGAGRIAGFAVDARSGQPLSDYSVSYEPDRGGGMGMMVRFASRGAGRRLSGIGERLEVHQDDGKFLLENVPSGTWQVLVEAKGHQSAHVGGVVVEEGVTRDNVEVRVSPGGALKGRVTDGRSGRAIPEATVSTDAAGAASGPMFGNPAENEITTDADGRFEVDGLAPGKVKVTARHADYSEASVMTEVKEAGSAVEIHLSTGGGISGMVTSDSRQGVAGVDVNLSSAGEGRMGFGGSGQSTMTDATGRFHFDHLTEGRYSVTATLRSASSAPAEVVLQAGESKEDVVLNLAAGATIRGVVSGLSDIQRNGVNVSASGPESYFASARTGADGRFELTGAPAGSISLRAQAGDFLGSTRTAVKQLTIGESQPVVETEIVFEPGYILSGRVTKGGAPVTDGTVFANQQGSGRSASARTDAGGGYRLEGLTQATYNVTAISGTFGRSAKSETVSLASDQNLDLEFPSARLAGNVVEAGTRQPLADAVIEFAGGASGGPFLRSMTTDSNGRFSLEDLEPKSYTLTVRKADYLFEKRDYTAAESGTDNLSIELTRGEGIGVQARDGLYNIPLRGLMVRVLDAQKSPVFTGSISLDSEGRGEIPSLKPGRYSLLADASGYAPAAVDSVSVPSSTLSLALTPGGNVEIHAGPKTLAAGSVRARFLSAVGLPYVYSLFAPDGQITLGTPVRRLENFAAGSYVLAVTGGESKPFRVNEGGTTLIELP